MLSKLFGVDVDFCRSRGDDSG